MWIQQIVLAVIGFSAGTAIAGGMFSFLIGLGVVSIFADRTHTGKNILIYEDAIAMGGITANIFYIFRIQIPHGAFLLPIYGLFSGIFVGCWAMALADVLNVFPIFIRRIKLFRAIPWIIIGMALGKGVGAFIFFLNRWGK